MDVQWRKSSKSAQGGNCVEIAELPEKMVGLRDSKDTRADRPVLTVGRGTWDSFVAGVLAGKFDLESGQR